jgi:hypothetical protein
MRKIATGRFVSLTASSTIKRSSPDDQTIEPYFDEAGVETIQSDQDEADTILLGRRT